LSKLSTIVAPIHFLLIVKKLRYSSAGSKISNYYLTNRNF